jgi:1-deoxy-D-xylulose-5-phosphate reductoisomerase
MKSQSFLAPQTREPFCMTLASPDRSSPQARKRVAVLGSTGSIGVQTLDVIARHPEELELVAAGAMRQVDRLLEQARAHGPKWLAVTDASALDGSELVEEAPALGCELLAGSGALTDLVRASQPDIVVVATVGAAGLAPTLAAIAEGIDVALANKEVLVCAGDLVSRAAREAGVALLPVDSEHNAVFQCLQGNRREDIRRVILTASGGPFRLASREEMAVATAERALAHPCWSMGPKISIDSATLMNKGFEVIEARWLFDLAPETVAAIVHPQSRVHALVEYRDGSIIAQIGPADMRLPIQHCLFHPERRSAAGWKPLDLAALGRLDFEPVDEERFPCFRLAREALAAGGVAGAVLNAANEVAVADFLAGRAGFLDIPATVEAALAAHPNSCLSPSLGDVLEADAWAREFASAACHS